MSNLWELVKIAEKAKPEFGQPCNNCGWCCLTEVCPTGVHFGKSTQIPCQYLQSEGNKHFCGLAQQGSEVMNEHLGIGTGCDAKTQREVFAELGLTI